MAPLLLTHLWSASNATLLSAPVVSRALAARLSWEARGRDGMAAAARRMHCGACGGLLVGARVRVRKASRKKGRGRGGGKGGKGGGGKARNFVVRTCAACAAPNVADGVRRGEREGREWDEVRGEDGVGEMVEGKGMAKAKAKGGAKAKAKAKAAPKTNVEALAGAFLFQPL